METKGVKLLKWTRIAIGEDITVMEVSWNLFQASKFFGNTKKTTETIFSKVVTEQRITEIKTSLIGNLEEFSLNTSMMLFE
jgi:hypothetical protein